MEAGGDLFALISLRQRWLQTRYGVLAQNIANADTPGYRPNDLPPDSFARMVERMREPTPGLQRTHPAHLPLERGSETGVRARPHEPPEIAPSGNAVVLAEELRRLGETRRNMLLDVNLVAKYRRLFRSALGAGN